VHRLSTSLGALGCAVLLALACSDEGAGPLFPGDAGLGGGSGGSGGSGASGGSGGSTAGSAGATGGGGGQAGASEMPGLDGGVDAGGSDAGCRADTDCDDQNPCTTDSCASGACGHGFAVAGTQCGSQLADACTAPDTCNAAGVCLPNHLASEGTACGSQVNEPCTNPDTCDANGVCQPNNEVVGTACGDPLDDTCTNPDVCDDFGACSPNHAALGTECGSTTNSDCANPDQCSGGACLPSDEPNGTACPGGSCTSGECVDGQPVGCPVDIASSLSLNLAWSSVGRPDLYAGGCDSANTPDYALVFTAPQAGTFRFTATGLVDSTPYTGADTSGTPTAPPDGDAVLTIAPGSCAGIGAVQIDCNDDGPPDDDSTDPQLDLVLTDQQVITVYINELTQTGGGTGTLSVTLVQ